MINLKRLPGGLSNGTKYSMVNQGNGGQFKPESRPKQHRSFGSSKRRNLTKPPRLDVTFLPITGNSRTVNDMKKTGEAIFYLIFAKDKNHHPHEYIFTQRQSR